MVDMPFRPPRAPSNCLCVSLSKWNPNYPQGGQHSLKRLMLLFLVTGDESCVTMEKTVSSVQTPVCGSPVFSQPLQSDPILFRFTSYKQGTVDVKKNLVTCFKTSAVDVWENILSLSPVWEIGMGTV